MDASVVERLWIRAAPAGPMESREALTLVAGQGIEGDHTFGRMRHVTLLFAQDWGAATTAIGHDVDPSARRANVLLSGAGDLGLVGRTVRLGEARVEIRGETRPCPVMDAAAEGLLEALRPEGRGGLWGRVLAGGVVRPGDVLAVED